MLSGVIRMTCTINHMFLGFDLHHKDPASHTITAGWDIGPCVAVFLLAGAIMAEKAEVQINGTAFFNGNSAGDSGGRYSGISRI